MPPEPFRVRSLPIGYGIFISARLLVRLIILYNAPFAQTKRQKFAASARYVKNRGECRHFPRCGRQPGTDGSVANFRLTTQSAPNARTSAPCRALQSLYKPMTCND
ncbi:hypothetical protein, partial [Neisseria gonorrhoeae]|uniref:hypothetical protein n=1 Tax=Neisseria gonorrhoeae TaxID=485 RepID=UPI0019D6D2F0